MNALKIIFIILFIVAVIFITYSVVKANTETYQPRVIYRYVPRSFIEDQENPVPIDDIFYFMFNNPDPWVAGVDVERRKRDIGENLNKYYLTRLSK